MSGYFRPGDVRQIQAALGQCRWAITREYLEDLRQRGLESLNDLPIIALARVRVISALDYSFKDAAPSITNPPTVVCVTLDGWCTHQDVHYFLSREESGWQLCRYGY